MIRQEAYEWIADTFGTNLAVAEWEGDLYPKYKRIKDVPEDLKVIALTNFIINRGIYQQVHRELYRLKKKIGKRIIKESTLYEKAIDNVLG